MSVRCASCGVPIALDVATEQSLRGSGSTFYCHVGHPQSFRTHPTKEEKEIERLREQLATTERNRAGMAEAWEEALEEREEQRVLARTCPACGEKQRTRQVLARHINSVHGEVAG